MLQAARSWSRPTHVPEGTAMMPAALLSAAGPPRTPADTSEASSSLHCWDSGKSPLLNLGQGDKGPTSAPALTWHAAVTPTSTATSPLGESSGHAVLCPTPAMHNISRTGTEPQHNGTGDAHSPCTPCWQQGGTPVPAPGCGSPGWHSCHGGTGTGGGGSGASLHLELDPSLCC